MKAGRELDSLVAEAMGVKNKDYCSDCENLFIYCDCYEGKAVFASYSTNISFAFELIDIINNLPEMERTVLSTIKEFPNKFFFRVDLQDGSSYSSMGDSYAEAICFVALELANRIKPL